MTPQDPTSSPVDEDQVMRRQMEQIVDSYDAYMSEVTQGQEHVLRETTVNLAQVKPGDSVLEVGCGTGTLTLAAKRQAGPSGKVYGIDVIPGMIELSQRKAAQANEAVTFQVGSIDDIPFPANHFDAVLCSFMIFHMSDATRRKGIAEIYRVLKPKGRLLILDIAASTEPPPDNIPQHDLQELRPLMEISGFSDIEIAPVAFQVQGAPRLAFMRGMAQKS